MFGNLKSHSENKISAQLWPSQRGRTSYFLCNYDDNRAMRCSWNVSPTRQLVHRLDAVTCTWPTKSSAHLHKVNCIYNSVLFTMNLITKTKTLSNQFDSSSFCRLYIVEMHIFLHILFQLYSFYNCKIRLKD